MSFLVRTASNVGELVVRRLAAVVIAAATTLFLLAMSGGVGAEAASSLDDALRRRAELAESGQHLAIFTSIDAAACERLASTRSGVVAAGPAGPASSSTTDSGAAITNYEISPGALRALDMRLVDVEPGSVLIGRALATDLGVRLGGSYDPSVLAAAARWDAPSPAEFAGRSIVSVSAHPAVVDRCFVRFAGPASANQLNGLSSVGGSLDAGPALWTWQLPGPLETERPVLRWQERPAALLPILAGVVAGIVVGLFTLLVEATDAATLRMIGVGRGVLAGSDVLRLAVLSALAGTAVVAAGRFVDEAVAGAFATASIRTVATSWFLSSLVLVIGRSLGSPWKRLRYAG